MTTYHSRLHLNWAFLTSQQHRDCGNREAQWCKANTVYREKLNLDILRACGEECELSVVHMSFLQQGEKNRRDGPRSHGESMQCVTSVKH